MEPYENSKQKSTDFLKCRKYHILTWPLHAIDSNSHKTVIIIIQPVLLGNHCKFAQSLAKITAHGRFPKMRGTSSASPATSAKIFLVLCQSSKIRVFFSLQLQDISKTIASFLYFRELSSLQFIPIFW